MKNLKSMTTSTETKTTTSKPLTVMTSEKVYPQIFVAKTNTARTGDPTYKLVVYPFQGIEPLFVECEDINKLTGETFKVDLTFDAENERYNMASTPVVCTKPTTEECKAKEAEVKAYEGKYLRIQQEIAENRKNEFFTKNETPAIPKDLVIDKSVWQTICATINFDIPIMLLGPKGCGKTQTAKELAKAMGYEFAMFNMGSAFKPKELFVGQVHAKENANGSVETTLVPSQFLSLFQSNEKVLIFLDEATRTPAAATNYLMTVIDTNQNEIYVPELGKAIKRGPNVRFIAAGNAGMQYTDTRTMDGAFWDRFQKFIVDYLSPKEELALILERVPGADAKIMQELIARANKCRVQEKSGDLTTGISTRQLLNMAKYISVGFTIDEVFNNVFLTNFINGNNNEIENVKALIQG